METEDLKKALSVFLSYFCIELICLIKNISRLLEGKTNPVVYLTGPNSKLYLYFIISFKIFLEVQIQIYL